MKKYLPEAMLFFMLVHLFYFQTRHAGFVTDFTGLAWRIEGSDWTGIFTSFGFPSLQPVLNAFLFCFYKLFGTGGLGWYVVFSSMHVLNGLLLWQTAKRMLLRFGVEKSEEIAIIGALFFLLSPYQTEVVVWRVCFNFLLSSSLVLGSIWLLLNWLDTGAAKWRLALFGVLLIGLFTFELVLVIPLICLAITLASNALADNRRLGSRLVPLLLPQLALIAGYFVLSKLYLGTWIGHYGAATHLRLPLPEVLGNFFRYGIKTLFFTRFYDHSLKESIFTAFNRPAILYPAVILVVGLLTGWIYYFKRLSPHWRVAGLLLVLFGIALLPIINLYFNYLLHIENDRYGYLASMFICMMLVLLLSRLPRQLFYTLSIAYFVVSGFMLHKAVGYWRTSTYLYQSLLADFRWYDRPEVYVLNLPDNYQGCLLFRDYSGENKSLSDALRYVKHQPYEGKLFEIAQYNLADAQDGIQVNADSTGALQVSFAQYGNWWWRKGIGASSYETPQYDFTLQDLAYRLQWKAIDPNTAIIYQRGGKWMEWTPQTPKIPDDK